MTREVVLEGFHAVKHGLRFGAAITTLATADRARLDRLVADLAPDLIADFAVVDEVTAQELAGIADPAPDTGVVAIAHRPADSGWTTAGGPLVLLESPTHHGNVGAVVRVAAAAGAGAVLTTGPLDPWHPAALRGSAGLHFALPVAQLEYLPDLDMPLVAWDPAGTPLPDAILPREAVHAFGSERRGLSEHLLDGAELRVAIPMTPGVSSLNLATSVAIALYALPPGPRST